MKVAGKAGGVIYFGTKAEPGFSADKVSGSFDLIGDGQWHEYTVEIRNPKWNGELAAIRLDIDGTQAGDSVAVDYHQADLRNQRHRHFRLQRQRKDHAVALH